MKMNCKRKSAQKMEAGEWTRRRRKEDPVFVADIQRGRREKWFHHSCVTLQKPYRPLCILSSVHLLKNKKKLFLLSKTRKETISE